MKPTKAFKELYMLPYLVEEKYSFNRDEGNE